MRYVKQRDHYSCGPVAIMNVLKWVGVRFNYQERIKVLQEACDCVPTRGTRHAAFDRALRLAAKLVTADVRIRRVHRPKLSQIEEHLRSGGAVVLNYRWKTDEKGFSRHFMLLTKVYGSGKYFLTVNDRTDGPAARGIHRATLKKFNLRFQRPDTHYKAWFVSVKD